MKKERRAWLRPLPMMLMILLTVLAALLEGGAARAEGRKLTLMVYMCGSNLESSYGSASADIREMMDAGVSFRDVSVLVMTGGSHSRDSAGFFSEEATDIYEIGPGRVRRVQRWERPLNMGDRETLEKMIRFGMDSYPAEKYALILWDHGGGPLEGVCWDETHEMDHLSLGEIAGALENTLAGQRLSWIGFDACLMGSLEVASRLAPWAEYMIASQETEPAFGWNYSFLSGLHLDADGAETGRRIVDAYFEGREDSREILTLGEKPYHADVLKLRRQYSDKSGKMEDMVYIEDHRFSRALLGDLQNAGYIAEQEDGQRLYLGSELSGQIYQKYLPGQFFTFSGKYYEMLSVTADGQVLVRRAADHITGRPVYRQVREYGIANAVDSTAVGACRDAGGIRMTRQYADIRVRTPAYWQMAQRGDFAGGRRVTISGVPEREYRNKQLLRVDFTRSDGGLTPEIRMTLTLLMNEVFVTLFGDNAAYITAVTPGTMEQPITCSIRGEGAYTPDPDAIYIIEDSQLDLGLLVAVERNLDRIFTIIRDYLDWHFEELDRSLNPPPAPVTPDYTQTEEPEEGETRRKAFSAA